MAADTLAVAQKTLKAKPTDAALKKKVDETTKAATAATEAAKTAAAALVPLGRASEGARRAVRIADDRLKEAKIETTAAEAAKKEIQYRSSLGNSERSGRSKPHRSVLWPSRPMARSWRRPAMIRPCNLLGRPHGPGSGQPDRPLGDGRQRGLGASTLVFSAAADQSLVVWDTNPVWSFVGRFGPKADTPLDTSGSSLAGRVLCLAFDPQGTLLATGSGEPSRSGELKIWNVSSLALEHDLKDAHSDTVFGVEFSPDGKYLASGAADKFVKVFECRHGQAYALV